MTTPTTVDQQRVRRTRSGLIAHDPDARAGGFYPLRADVRRRHRLSGRHERGGRPHLDAAPPPGGLRLPARQRSSLLFGQGRGRREALRGVGAVQGRRGPRGGLARQGRVGGPPPGPSPRCPQAAQRQRHPAVPASRCRRRCARRVRGGLHRHRDRRHHLRRLPGGSHDSRRGRLGVAELGAPGLRHRGHHAPGPPRGVDARQHGGRDAQRQPGGQLPQHLDGRHHRSRHRARSSGSSAARPWPSSTIPGRCPTATSSSSTTARTAGIIPRPIRG